MTAKYKYIITNDYIKTNYAYDFQSKLTNASDIDAELKQNYNRLLSYITSHNVLLRSSMLEYPSTKALTYNKSATNPLDAFYNQFLDYEDDNITLTENEYRIDMWKQAQATQLIYELDNGAVAYTDSEMPRICPETLEILRNSLNLLWRNEWMKG